MCFQQINLDSAKVWSKLEKLHLSHNKIGEVNIEYIGIKRNISAQVDFEIPYNGNFFSLYVNLVPFIFIKIVRLR